MIINHMAAWLLTVFLHLALAIALAQLLTARLEAGPWRERLWRLALAGALLTGSLQTFAGSGPFVWHMPTLQAEGGAGIGPSNGALQLANLESGPELAGAPPAALTDSAVAHNGSERNSSAGAAADPISVALVTCWLLIALSLCLRDSLMRRRFLRALHRGQLRGRDDLLRLVEELRPVQWSSSGQKPWQKLRLSVSASLRSPIALSSNEICLPVRALEEFSTSELQASMAHELAHIVRRDPFWLRVYALYESVFFFQPFLRRATKALRAEAELACDDWAVERGVDALGLARSLGRIAAWQPKSPVALPAMAAQSAGLVHRVNRLTTHNEVRCSRPRIAITCSAFALGLGAFACAGPGMSPNQAAMKGSSEPNTLRIELQDAGIVFAEGVTWVLPDESQELRDFLVLRGGTSESIDPDKDSELRVVIDVPDETPFSRVEGLMHLLASQRVWRLEFSLASGPNLRVPLPRDAWVASDLIGIEEETIAGPAGDGALEPADESGAQVAARGARKAEVRLRVKSESPRVVQYSLDQHRTQSLEEFEGLATKAREENEPLAVLIDAGPGILHMEVLSTIEALILSGLTDMQLMFVASHAE
jgi:beta-lactamase regulating signal transducer with metallopeptidase domain